MLDFKRSCPLCNKEIFYKHKSTFKTATINNTNCVSCNKKGVKNSNYKGKIWLGRKHKESTKEKISKTRIERKDIIVTKEFKEKMSIVTSGKNNPMYGKSVYSTWLEKFGKNIADKKLSEFKNKLSIANKGKNNPMFGKPSPLGSGNGWSGWYNGFYFRSLHELNFLYYEKRFNISLINGEIKKYKIPYINLDNEKKNYFSDYIIEGKYIIEIKPKKLWSTPINKLKFIAGKRWAKDNLLKFKIIDCGPIDSNIFDILYNNGEVKLIKRYELKYLENNEQ